MPRFEPDFAGVVAHCTKPNCERTFLHRHHIENEAIWIALAPDTWEEQVLLQMADRYHDFVDSDISYICAWHHAEIHMLCDLEIEKIQRRKQWKPLRKYTLREARAVMKRCRTLYEDWITRDTPGIDPNYLRPFRRYPLMKGEMQG